MKNTLKLKPGCQTARLLIPVASSGGSPTVSRTVPFTKAYSQVGIKGDPFVFKGLELQNDVVTAKEYEEAFKKWQQEKIETMPNTKKNLKNTSSNL